MIFALIHIYPFEHIDNILKVLIHLSKNDFVKAEKLFIDVMQRQLSYKGVAKDDNSIIAMSLKLAIIFSKTEQHEKAQQGFGFCIDTQETKIKAGMYI